MVICSQFKEIIEANSFFAKDEKLQEFLLKAIQINFLNPEATFINQYDTSNRSLYIVGDGSVSVINLVGGHRKVLVLVLGTGSILNEATAIYGQMPKFTYQSRAYTTLAMIR